MHHTDLAWKSLVSAIVVFQFDGSFRPPKDPGCPTLNSKLATCASCLFRSSDNGRTLRPLAVGSRFLPIPVDMTSGHAEYEGLLLGLEWLSTKTKDSSPTTNEKDHLIIQGDCKTVIDQLSGTSISRKLQTKHKQAELHLNEISRNFDKIVFQHIPRNQNSICDNLCANTITAAASSSWKSCLTELENMDRPLMDIFVRYCKSNSSWIRNSIRPALYSKLFQIAQEQHEYNAMVVIGELLFTESQQYSKDKSSILKAQGIKYQLSGLRGLGQERKASALERKYRILLKSLLRAEDPIHVPIWTDIRSTAETMASWDEAIPKEWNPLLSEWWAQAEPMESWEEGATIWTEDTQSLLEQKNWC
jgi:ribonuclease HI